MFPSGNQIHYITCHDHACQSATEITNTQHGCLVSKGLGDPVAFMQHTQESKFTQFYFHTFEIAAIMTILDPMVHYFDAHDWWTNMVSIVSL